MIEMRESKVSLAAKKKVSGVKYEVEADESSSWRSER